MMAAPHRGERGADKGMLITSSEAAERMGVSVKVLRRLRTEGRIRYIAITDRKIMYQVEDCDRWISGAAPAGASGRPLAASPTPTIIPFTQRRGSR